MVSRAGRFFVALRRAGPFARLPHSSVDGTQSIRDELREHISVEHDDDADNGSKGHGIPENEAENGAFLPDLIRRGSSDADGLRVDHFAHHAAGTVGRAHQNGAESELLSSDLLEAAKKNVGRSVASRQRDAEPANECAEEGKEPARASESETEDRVHARVARDVAQAEHAGHGNDSEAQPDQRAAEDLDNFQGRQSEDQACKDGREETARSRRCEPIEIETRGFGGGFCYDGRGAKHSVVQVGPIPSRGAGPRFAVSKSDLESGCGCFVNGELNGRQSPQENEDGKNCEGQPGFGDLAGGVVLDDILPSYFGRVFFAFLFKTPNPFWMPDAQKQHRC